MNCLFYVIIDEVLLKMKRTLFAFFLLFVWLHSANAQLLEVAEITISGNKKTKEKIIKREIIFEVGQKIPAEELDAILERSQQNIQNTGLFVKTEIDTERQADKLFITFNVFETWYIYPQPIFELADRNFNVWWKEQNRSLARVNFGIRGIHLNLTGHRDKLKLTLQDGYTKKYELDYFFPGINKEQTLGFFANLFFSRGREIAFITQQNKLLFYDFNEEFQLQRFRASAGLSFRPGFYTFHTFKTTYGANRISDDVAFVENPEYFLNNSNRQRHLILEYNFTFDNRDIKPYPLNGQLFSATIQKDGVGLTDDVNALITSFTYQYFHSFNEKLSLGLIGSARFNLQRHKQPYTQVSSFGYDENIIHGYELFVIDGMDHGFVKTAFRFQLLNNEFNWGKAMFIKQFRQMPYKLYFVINNDAAYINAPYYDHYGDLNNQLLWGGGVGLHLLVYFDKLIQVEYNINKFGEKGLFLSFDLSL